MTFVVQERDTAERDGREWVAGNSFAVRLTRVEEDGPTMRLTGTHAGGIAMTHPPNGRARVQGTFAVTGTERPLYPPRPPG